MNFNKTYQINPEFDILPVGKDSLLCSVKDKIYTIKDIKYKALIHAINGKQSCEEVVTSLRDRYDPAELYYSLYDLEDKGLLIESYPLPKVRTNINKEILQQYYTNSKIGSLTITVKPLPSLLPHAGFDSNLLLILDNSGNQQEKEVIDIIFCANLLDDEVYEAFQKSIALKHCFFPIQIAESYYWLGPLFTPRQKPCIQCLTHRLRKHRPLHKYIQKKSRPLSSYLPGDAFIKTISIAFNEILPALPDAKNNLCSYDVTGSQKARHPVNARPQCPICGDSTLFTLPANKPIVFQNTVAEINSGAVDTFYDPELTLKKFKHLADPVTGIVSSIFPICENTESSIFVHEAQFIMQPTIDQLSRGVPLIQTCFGKGKTFDQSRTSALCEVLERYCSIFHGDEPKIRESYNTLEPDAILPESLINYSINQYNDSEYVGGPDSPSPNMVIHTYHPEEITDWTQAWSLTYNKARFLPFSFCYGYAPISPEKMVCYWSTNGNAAGNTWEEAVINGFLELVERDSVAIWWYNRISSPKIDLDSFDDEYFHKIRKYCEINGWDMWCLDLTTDLTIPSIVALARHRITKNYFAGFGAHFSMRKAVNKALLELSQVLAPADRIPFFWNEKDLADTHFLKPSEIRYCSDPQNHRWKDISGAQKTITKCIDVLKENSLELIVLHLTRPDVGLPVVKVIVPGLRHFWRNLGPGRLYDVPLKMKWITHRNQENDLNPISLNL